jgi:hypothetical protein
MKARQLIGGASYGPDELKVLFKAFDEVWEGLAPHVEDDPQAIEAARLKLANIVLGLAVYGSNDAERIKSTALQIMGPAVGRH